MTSTTQTGQGGQNEDERLREVLRAEAAAALDDDLDGDLGVGVGDDSAVREKTASGSPGAGRPRSQVYSIRVPVERLEQLRRLAKERGSAPTAMLREWVLDRLDQERQGGQGGSSDVNEKPAAIARAPHDRDRPVASRPAPSRPTVSQDLDLDLAKALGELSTIAAQCPEAVGTLARLLLAQEQTIHSTAIARQVPLTLSTAALEPPATGGAGPRRPGVAARQAASTRRSSASFLMGDYLEHGLGDLQSTVADVSRGRRFDNVDLGKLYVDADEELFNP